MRTKAILNVTPFNDVFFKGCFYNSLFTLFLYYNIDIYKYLINDVIYYNYQQETGLISSEYLETKSLYDSLKEDSIQFFTEKCCKDIFEKVITAIDNGRPSIVVYDPYYNSVRQDVYRKMHLSHSILINGYDRIRQLVYVIEHKQWENLAYEQLAISFNDMQESYYKGVIQDSNPPFTYFEIIENSPVFIDLETLQARFQQCMIENKTILIEGLHSLDCFINNYSTVTLDQEELKHKSNSYLNSFNSIISSKQIERYRVAHLFGNNSKLLSSIETVIESWSKVRAFLCKYLYSDVYDRNNFLRSRLELEKLFIEEERFIANITSSK